jgi:hypothetical protein
LNFAPACIRLYAMLAPVGVATPEVQPAALLDRPLGGQMSVRNGRDAYLAENGFTVAAYGDRWTEASFFGIPFKVLNTKKHRWGIMLHDLHHVATGYGTDLAGEGEISAWEERRGLRNLGPYLGSIVVSGALLGLLLYPRRTLAAWRRGSGKSSLFQSHNAYETLLNLTVSELRAKLGLPDQGLAEQPRNLHPRAPLR